VKILYLCYSDINEPLVQTQVLSYLRELTAREVEIHLLTFDKKHSQDYRKQLAAALAKAGITWHSLRYHKQPPLLATLYDIAIGVGKAWAICRRHQIRCLHARSHVPAAMAWALQRLSGYRWLFDLRGLMAEEYVDGGNWRVGDYKFHLTKRLERTFFRAANEMVLLTERIKRELLQTEPALAKRAAEITVIPCCVDLLRFDISEPQRNAYRAERGWAGKRVMTYVGKIGTWYLHEEMAQFFAFVWRHDPRFYWQILTQSDPAPLRQALTKAGVPTTAYNIRFASPEQLPLVLTAADVGISFIRPCYSKRASSPTKNGEYLAAGLPLIINAGIGDTDEQTETQRLGIVLREFSAAEFQRGVAALEELLSTDKVKKRCRDFAARELSLATVGAPRYAAIYGRLLSSSPRVVAAIEGTSA
jgi:glycosyltransferase involved in cell wall biosynthesis